MSEAWVIDHVRTPRGKGKKETGALYNIHPQELFAQTLNALIRRDGLDPRDVEDVVVGTVSEIEDQGGCIARMAVLAAGWPSEATGVSLNRFCGSGLQAVNFAAMGVMSGQQDLVVGGGVESMSRVPLGSDKSGLDGHNRHLRELHALVPQGVSADLIATLEGFSRADCDRFALESQRRCNHAVKNGYFKKSMEPVKDLDGKIVLAEDEYPRPETTLEGLGKLEPSFLGMGAYRMKDGPLTFDEKAKNRYPQIEFVNHVHTAGNSSGIVDGASVVLLAAPDYAKSRGWKPRARIIATATYGDDPVIMLTAPVPASKRCLKKAGMTVNDIDLFEINEAFAAVPLKVMKDLGIPHDKVNVNGGAIALGHPLGATGAMLLGTALDELERINKTTALITMCIGGGMGISTIIERI
ncbi:MAG: acetyl-CoA C-acetyltransferase [Candidatus Binatus sp.]|uniref:acetyl-CoA C-acetyltransferase n=1 Tax=Candidatus Binatus sp. TaxID=2811406 RepID=UPI00271BD3A1|nr:acetyl-CoA C-acetyltransferase [Candidatus Binatus sp.]MDO8434744.1 acetyl-CoA C-acetyltransferase [Candidatus Binatus sp.]